MRNIHRFREHSTTHELDPLTDFLRAALDLAKCKACGGAGWVGGIDRFYGRGVYRCEVCGGAGELIEIDTDV